MSTIVKILKTEMQRISRRETNQAIVKLRKDLIALKKTVADQKRRIADLEKMNRALSKQQTKFAQHPAVQAEMLPKNKTHRVQPVAYRLAL